MSNENKLVAPKAVRGFKTPNANFKSAEPLFDRDLSILISPSKKGSSNNLKSRFLSTQKELNFFDFEKEIVNDFDELSVKSEIFSILKNESTRCDYSDIRNSNPTKKTNENIIFLEEGIINDSDKNCSPQRIQNPIYKVYLNNEFKSEGDYVSDFSIHNM